jgi:hypothetical protein
LPATSDLAAMATEGELLDEVGYGLSDWSEPHFDMAVGCDVRHTSGQPQRLREGIMQVDFGHTLFSGFR